MDDASDLDALSEGERAAAEAEMRARDRDEGRGRSMRRGLVYDSEDVSWFYEQKE